MDVNVWIVVLILLGSVMPAIVILGLCLKLYTEWVRRREVLVPSLLDQIKRTGDDGIELIIEELTERSPLLTDAVEELANLTSKQRHVEAAGSSRSDAARGIATNICQRALQTMSRTWTGDYEEVVTATYKGKKLASVGGLRTLLDDIVKALDVTYLGGRSND